MKKRAALIVVALLWATCASAAAPAYRSHTVSAFATAADITATEPASCATNDIEVATLLRESTTAITGATGWSQSFNGTTMSVDTTAGTPYRVTNWWIRRTGSAPSLTWTFASSFRGIAIVCYSGAVTSGDPFDIATSALRDTLLAKTWPNVSGSTSTTDELLIWVGNGSDVGGAGTPPTGFTERADAATGMEIADLAQAATGTTGTVTGGLYGGGTNNTTDTAFVSLKSTSGGAACTPTLMLLGVGRCG